VFALIPLRYAGEVLVAEWTATARNADGVASGTLPITIDATPVVVARVIEEQPDSHQSSN
jgi:hypothetical protein